MTSLDSDPFLTATGSHLARELSSLLAGEDRSADGGAHAASVWTLGAYGAEEHGRIEVPDTDRSCVIMVSREHVIVAPENSNEQRCPQCLWLNWLAVQGPTTQLLRLAVARSTATQSVPLIAAGIIGITAALSLRAMRGASPHDVYIELDSCLLRSTALQSSPWCPNHQPDDEGPRAPALLRLSQPQIKRQPSDDRLGPPPRGDLKSACSPVGGTASAETPEPKDGITASVTGLFTSANSHHFTVFAWGGHSTTYAQALDIGLVEAHERLASLRRPGTRRYIRTSLSKLGADGFDPRRLGEYRPDAYNDPTLQPFDPERDMNWVQGHSLVSGKATWVPVSTAYFFADTPDKGATLASSSGCASGSCFEEATLHALLELLERDAFLTAWYGETALPRVDKCSLDSIELARLDAAVRLRGYGITLLDGTNAIGVPTIIAIAERVTPGWGSTTFGASANLDIAAAAVTATKEAAFRVPGFEARALEARDHIEAMFADYSKVTGLGDHALLFGHPEMKSRVGGALGWLHDTSDHVQPPSTEQIPGQDSSRLRPESDLTRDLANLVERVTSLAADVIVIDLPLKQSQNRISTVRVLAPGLLPIDFGWNRQRALHSPRVTRLRDALPRVSRPAPHPFP